WPRTRQERAETAADAPGCVRNCLSHRHFDLRNQESVNAECGFCGLGQFQPCPRIARAWETAPTPFLSSRAVSSRAIEQQASGAPRGDAPLLRCAREGGAP